MSETITRFWSKVDRSGGPDSCWLWQGSQRHKGYGRFILLNDLKIQAHRFAYIIEVGPIPPGMHLDHVRARGCTNRLCVNPAHLEAVTPTENNRRSDSPTAVNARKTHCIHGHLFDEANMYNEMRNGRPRRRCRTCHITRTRAKRAA